MSRRKREVEHSQNLDAFAPHKQLHPTQADGCRSEPSSLRLLSMQERALRVASSQLLRMIQQVSVVGKSYPEFLGLVTKHMD
jgi:hypothetical protein